MLRRAILVVTGTAAAVTSALIYHPPQLTQVSTSSKPTTPAPADSTAPSGNATPKPNASQSAAPTSPSNLPTGNFGRKGQTKSAARVLSRPEARKKKGVVYFGNILFGAWYAALYLRN